jgi:hypothetical protein
MWYGRYGIGKLSYRSEARLTVSAAPTMGGFSSMGGRMSDGDGQKPEELRDLLGVIWSRVVRQVNRLLETHAKYGFFTFKENLNPSLEEVVEGFKEIELALSTLEASKHLEHDEQRTVLNSKQCILKIRMLALALEEHNDKEYELIINDLSKQQP